MPAAPASDEINWYRWASAPTHRVGVRQDWLLAMPFHCTNCGRIRVIDVP